MGFVAVKATRREFAARVLDLAEAHAEFDDSPCPLTGDGGGALSPQGAPGSHWDAICEMW